MSLSTEVYSHGGMYSKEGWNLFKEKFEEECLPDRLCIVALKKKFERAAPTSLWRSFTFQKLL